MVRPPGTFCLTDEAMDEPRERLESAAKAAGLAPEAFVAVRHGAMIATAGGADSVRPALMTQ